MQAQARFIEDDEVVDMAVSGSQDASYAQSEDEEDDEIHFSQQN